MDGFLTTSDNCSENRYVNKQPFFKTWDSSSKRDWNNLVVTRRQILCLCAWRRETKNDKSIELKYRKRAFLKQIRRFGSISFISQLILDSRVIACGQEVHKIISHMLDGFGERAPQPHSAVLLFERQSQQSNNEYATGRKCIKWFRSRSRSAVQAWAGWLQRI